MGKQLILEGETLDRFKSKFGDNVDPNNFYCIRVRAVSTEPVTQGTIFNGAVTTENTLIDMAHIVNHTDENVGVLTMHDSSRLNVGRCFYAEVKDEGEVKSLTAYMAILKNEETESLISKIENNVLDEVSVSFVPRKAKCNKCGFDYMSDEASAANWYTMTCNEGHEIGKEGTHLIIDGTDDFTEISIVNRGAAESAKILNNETRSYFSKDKTETAFKNTPIVCFSRLEDKKMEETKLEEVNVEETKLEEVEEIKVDFEKELADAKAEITELKNKLDLEIKLKDLEAKLAEKESVIADLEAKLAEKQTKIEEDKALIEQKDSELSAEKGEKEKVLEFLKKEVKKVLVASASKDEVPEDLDGISKLLDERQTILASLIPAGGVSASSVQFDKNKVNKMEVERLKAFQVKK